MNNITHTNGDAAFGETLDELNPMSVPSLAYIAFQCSFAMITPALISGGVVGRMKLVPYMIFIFLWTTFCYDLLARWIFSSQGWLNRMGVLDFAGGLVVHISSGISGLVAAFILGSRAHFDPDVVNAGQTNLPFTILGTGLLWVGWMGFNGESALVANGIVALAIVNINVAAASSMIIWIILDIVYKKCRDHNTNFLSIPDVCSATVVGLVVITPGAGYVQPGYALLMGFIGGPIQLGYQILGIVITISYSAVCTAAILLLMHFMIGIRINRHEQVRGLDNVVHGVLDLEQTYQVQQMKLSSTKPKTIMINLPVTSTAE